jgi:endo-1,3(4)-beta-glucanase
VEFRVYAIFASGAFVGSDYQFSSSGVMNRNFDGWLRLARVKQSAETAVLDEHAQAVLIDFDLDVRDNGVVQYNFVKEGRLDVPLLHLAYAHHLSMLGPTARVTSLQIRSPTKGLMTGVVGDAWELQSDLQEAEAIDFLPMGEPQGDRYSFLRTEAFQTLEYFLGNWRSSMFVGTYYFSGKGFQKVGMVCLLMEKFYGENDPQTKACAEILVQGFKCLYDRPAAGDCSGAPPPLAYDLQWGGIVTTAGLTDTGCMGATDFGGACYNDHHYHYGYYVVAAAIAAKILPAYRTDASFTAFVDSLIRDTTNPSRQDMHFPRFRSFDWFDLHSWSRGVTPSADGKDQESTSEEVNLLYGIHLWGGVISRPSLKRLGTVMLSLAAASIREFFK